MRPVQLVSTLDMPRETWLEYRRSGIGGSDAPGILGMNPYSSAINVYMDKLGLAPEKEETEAMWLGTKLEPIIAERFEQKTGKKTMRRNFLFQHAEHPWMLANIDRWVVGEDCGLEIKTTSMMNRSDFEGGQIPQSYYAQCAHYMAVMDVRKWYLAVEVLNKDFHVFEIERNDDEIATLIATEKAFWEENVLLQNPPAPDGSERAGELIKSRFPSGRGDGLLVPLYGLEDDIARYKELDAAIKGLEKEQEAIKQRIQMEIGEADGGQASGWMVRWKTVTTNRLDTDRLKKEQPETYAKYVKTSESRRFEVKQEEAIND